MARICADCREPVAPVNECICEDDDEVQDGQRRGRRGRVIPKDERVLLRLFWVDATNVAGGWFDNDDLAAWAANGAWECSNTGWLVYENDHCYVLAGRMTDDGNQVGLLERVPKAAVTGTVKISGPASRSDR